MRQLAEFSGKTHWKDARGNDGHRIERGCFATFDIVCCLWKTEKHVQSDVEEKCVHKVQYLGLLCF